MTIYENFNDNVKRLLLFQTDTILLKDNIEDFFKYDFIGAAWCFSPYKGCNGGLSLRNRQKMLEICKSHKCTENEDGFFSYTHENMLNLVPILEDKNKFSMETIWCDDPMGMHRAYGHHKNNEKEIEEQNIMIMSKSTQYLLHCIDYKKNSQKNLENFKFLHSQLKYHNKINIDIDHIEKNSLIPMIYPFLINKDIRNNLINNKIYVSNWWKYLLQEVNLNSFEYRLSKYLLPLPIDYRYQTQNMNIIIKNIQQFL